MPAARPPAASSFSLRQRVMFAAKQNQYRDSQNQYRQRSANLNHVRNQQPIFSGGGIVVIAEQQYLISGRADFSFGRFDQSQPQLARRVLNPVKVTRNFSFGSQQRDGAVVRELLAVGIVGVMKT